MWVTLRCQARVRASSTLRKQILHCQVKMQESMLRVCSYPKPYHIITPSSPSRSGEAFSRVSSTPEVQKRSRVSLLSVMNTFSTFSIALQLLLRHQKHEIVKCPTSMQSQIRFQSWWRFSSCSVTLSCDPRHFNPNNQPPLLRSLRVAVAEYW